MTDRVATGVVIATFPADAGYTYRAELQGAVWRVLRLTTPAVGAHIDANDPITPQEQGIRDPAYWIARSKAVAE